MIAWNERHLLRLLRDYVSYHHKDRLHDALGKDTPESRPIERKPTANAMVIALPRRAACAMLRVARSSISDLNAGTTNELWGHFLCRGVHSNAAATVLPTDPSASQNLRLPSPRD
jgi:hypothetical protein